MFEEMLIVCDNREQLPYLFDGQFYQDHGVKMVRGTLGTGDYAVTAWDGEMAIVERKSLDDLANCCGNDRERFLREMQRALAYRAFCIVVEGSWVDMRQHKYHSQIHPESVLGTLFMLQSRFNIPCVFAQDRLGGQYATWQFLRQFLRGAEQYRLEKRVSQAEYQKAQIRVLKERAAEKTALPASEYVQDEIFGRVKRLSKSPPTKGKNESVGRVQL